MKDKFNYKLFLEGMRQLRVIGIMGLIIFCVEAVFCVIGYNINIADATYAGTPEPYVETFNLMQLHWILYGAFYVLVPVMLLYLFGFLNKRNASDFYHSVPVKRACLAVSFLAAIMAWVLIIVFASTALTCIATAFAPYVALNMYSVFVSLAAVISACLCVLGAGFLAMSITGTYFSNFAVSVMLLVFPRLILMAYLMMLEYITPVIADSISNGILDYRLNIVVGSILRVLENDAYPVEHFLPVLYTFILACVYFAFGFYAFLHRKSEVATMSAGSGKLQLIFRLVPSMSISLISIYFIISVAKSPYRSIYSDNTSKVFYIILFYVIAVIAYFLYELISTKKLSNIAKSAKGLWALVVYNVVFIAALFAGYYIVLSDVPEASDVKYVSITKDFSSYSSNGYFSNTSSQVRITNEEVINLLTASLSDNVNDIKNDNYFKKGGYGYSTIHVEYKSGLRKIHRVVQLNVEDYAALYDMVGNDEEYARVYKELPEYDSISEMRLNCGNYYVTNEEEKREIYDSLCQEMRTLSFKDAYDIAHSERIDSIGVFRGTCSRLNENYSYAIYLTDKTPKTTLLAINKVNSENPVNPVRYYADANADKDMVYELGLSLALYDDGECEPAYLSRLIGADEDTYTLPKALVERLTNFADELDNVSAAELNSLNRPILKVSLSNGTNGTIMCRYYAANDEIIEYFNMFTDKEKEETTYKNY